MVVLPSRNNNVPGKRSACAGQCLRQLTMEFKLGKKGKGEPKEVGNNGQGQSSWTEGLQRV